MLPTPLKRSAHELPTPTRGKATFSEANNPRPKSAISIQRNRLLAVRYHGSTAVRMAAATRSRKNHTLTEVSVVLA